MNFNKDHLKTHIPEAIERGWLRQKENKLIITREGKRLAMEIIHMSSARQRRFKALSEKDQLSMMLEEILCQIEVFASHRTEP